MTHPTDEELESLVKRMESVSLQVGIPSRTALDSDVIRKAAYAITTLRAQLAEMQIEKEKLGREVNIARYGQPDFSWQIHKEALAEANARVKVLEDALQRLHHAVCGETGFAQSVRDCSGLAYPWPALDEADALARAALATDQERDALAWVRAEAMREAAKCAEEHSCSGGGTGEFDYHQGYADGYHSGRDQIAEALRARADEIERGEL